MNQQRHIIKRQVIEIKTDSQPLAQEIQSRISQRVTQQINKLLDQHCSRLSSPDTIHRIQYLEIDLGVINVTNLENDFTKKFNSQLKQQLALYIKPYISESTETPVKHKKFTSQLELLSYFANTGRLPWWADVQQTQLLERTLDFLLQNTQQLFQQKLREFIRQESPLIRLIQYYDNTRLIQLLVLVANNHQHELHKLAERFTSVMPQLNCLAEYPTSQIKQATWYALFNYAINTSQDSPYYSGSDVVLHIISKQLAIPYVVLLNELQVLDSSFFANKPHKDEHPTLSSLILKLKNNPENPELLNKIHTLIPKPNCPEFFLEEVLIILQQIKFKASDPKNFLTAVTNITQAIDTKSLNSQDQHPFRKSQLDNDDTKTNSFSSADEIYINNAGLVILWPFMQRFFENMQWLQKKRFKDDSAQQDAVTALHYLATGETKALEFMLPLNKLICGMQVDTLYAQDSALSQSELIACDELLKAVIANAPILKNTSLPGFRTSFLNRQGILSKRDGAWLLQVERETFDLILDRFPWSFEWFKLPWMPLAMRVEW